MGTYTLIQGDVKDWLRAYQGAYFHAFFDDPPYNLESIRKRFGGKQAAQATGGVYHRSSRGFMGKAWDTNIAFDPELWLLTMGVLYPGAFGLSFGGTRTSWQMAAAADAVDFEITGQIAYCYGSGFPKAHNISKKIQEASGEEAVVVGVEKKGSQDIRNNNYVHGPTDQLYLPILDFTTPLAQTFAGHRGGSPLKPAYEPVFLMRRPYGEVTSDELYRLTGWDHWCVVKELPTRKKAFKRLGVSAPKTLTKVKVVVRKALHAGAYNSTLVYDGDTLLAEVRVSDYTPWKTDSIAANAIVFNAGTINIDAGRIEGSWTWGTQTDIRGAGYNSNRPSEGDVYAKNVTGDGRWPADLILQHNPDCTGKGCTPHCPVKELADQMGVRTSGTGAVKGASSKGYQPNAYGTESRPAGTPNVEYGDTGTVDRYFYQADWSHEILERLVEESGLQYVTKPTRREKDAGIDLPPVLKQRLNSGGLSNDPRWAPVPARNNHPTTKSIAFCKYAAGLLLPPQRFDEQGQPIPRRILVRFAGSGSEMIGCLLAGWDEVVGIELEADHIPLATHRLDFWQQMISWGLTDVAKILKLWDNESTENQTGYTQLPLV